MGFSRPGGINVLLKYARKEKASGTAFAEQREFTTRG